jgi:hypothetical protein
MSRIEKDQFIQELEREATEALKTTIKYLISIPASTLALVFGFLSFVNQESNNVSFIILFVLGTIALTYVLFSALFGLLHIHQIYMTRIGYYANRNDLNAYDPDVLNKPMDDLVWHVKKLNFIMIIGATLLFLFVFENLPEAPSLIESIKP